MSKPDESSTIQQPNHPLPGGEREKPPPHAERGPGKGPVQTTATEVEADSTAALDAERVRLRAVNRGDSYIGQTAELVLAGVAIISAEGATWARERVDAADFYDARCWRLVDFGARARDVYGDKRIRYLAGVTNTEPAWLRQLEDRAPVMFDTSGSFAAEVRAAAAHRHRAAALAAELEEMTGAQVIVTPRQLTLEEVAS
jgi:hypothetical protein